MRKLHDSLSDHYLEIVALGELHPPSGRIEALNNNWEPLVRQARGYRNLQDLPLELRFQAINPIVSVDGLGRFLVLGLPTPMRKPLDRYDVKDTHAAGSATPSHGRWAQSTPGLRTFRLLGVRFNHVERSLGQALCIPF